jgi:hypothetical protein
MVLTSEKGEIVLNRVELVTVAIKGKRELVESEINISALLFFSILNA